MNKWCTFHSWLIYSHDKCHILAAHTTNMATFSNDILQLMCLSLFWHCMEHIKNQNVKKIFMCQNDTQAIIKINNKQTLSQKCIYFLYAITQRSVEEFQTVPYQNSHCPKRDEQFHTSVAKFCCTSVLISAHGLCSYSDISNCN